MAWLWDQPMGVGSDRGQRSIVPNKHTKQLHSKNSAQFYVVGPIHAAPAIPACHKRPFAHIWPPNGQTAEDRAEPSPPLVPPPRPPLNSSPDNNNKQQVPIDRPIPMTQRTF
jgi:hypothetical protein